MKRLMALLLMLCIALTGMALAEDELYEEVDDSEFNEDEVIHVVGAVYPDKVLSDFDSNSPALYTARMTAYTSGYVDRDIESTRVFRVGENFQRAQQSVFVGFIRKRFKRVVFRLRQRENLIRAVAGFYYKHVS